jgi:hypothetical protein
MFEDRFWGGYMGLTPRAKTTVIAVQFVPSVKPFSVSEEPSVDVLVVDWANMNGRESRRSLSERCILEVLGNDVSRMNRR